MIENERFIEVCDQVVNSVASREGIGTLSEKTLHSVLKNYYEPNLNNQEIKVGAKVADILNDTGIIEIQTKQFNKLRGKLSAFLPQYPVIIVYPIACCKWISWIDETTGEVTPRRKSPKKGKPQQAFVELYKIKDHLKDPNFNLRIVMVEVEEYRFLNGWSKDRKKGSSCSDRIPIALEEEITIESPSDYRKLIPEEIPKLFTTKDYAKFAKVPTKIAQVSLNVLCSVGTIDLVGKQGRLKLYKKNY